MFRLLSRGSAVVGRRSIVIDVQQHIANAVPDPPARRPQRSEEEKEKLKAALGKVTFLSSYEFESLRAPRSNAAGELFSQQKLRIENREHFIHELQSIVAKSTSEVDAWDRIDSAAEHASAKLENDLDDKQKVREFSDWNMIYIAPDTHREIIRHNDIPDLPPATQAEFYRIKENWFPEEYRSTQGIDIQLAAAFSPELRKRFSEEVTRIGKQAEAEAKTDAERKLIQQEIANSLDAIDPTRDITDAAIAAANLDELRVFAERVQAYNGDERLLAIYTRAAKLQGVDRSKFLSAMKEALYSSKLSPLGEPKSSSWDPAWDPAKGNEAAPQIQAAH